MAYTVLTQQPSNLQAGETAVSLEDGTIVAVSVVSKRKVNNAGVDFTVTARCLDDEGNVKTCPSGDPITIEFTHSATADEINQLTVNGVAKEMMLAVLGEPLTVGIKDGEEVPLINWSDAFLTHVSIKSMVAVANQTGPIDTSALL